MIWMLRQKGKLFFDVYLVTSKSFINFGRREGHHFEFQIWKIENQLNSKGAEGPHVSRPAIHYRMPQSPRAHASGRSPVATGRLSFAP
jgi:hypothetical protein